MMNLDVLDHLRAEKPIEVCNLLLKSLALGSGSFPAVLRTASVFFAELLARTLFELVPGFFVVMK